MSAGACGQSTTVEQAGVEPGLKWLKGAGLCLSLGGTAGSFKLRLKEMLRFSLCHRAIAMDSSESVKASDIMHV